MGIFKKKNEYLELDTLTFGITDDALNAVKIVDSKMQQYDDDSPVVTAALVFIPGYALGLFLMMLTNSYANRQLGDISNASQEVFMNTINDKFAKAILNILIFGKHTSEEDARSNTESILNLSKVYYDRVAADAVAKGGDILANMMQEAPLLFVNDAINFARLEKDSPEADAISEIATSIATILQKRYEDKWLFNFKESDCGEDY